MAVLHDYECAAHGIFESDAPKCPHGCGARFVRLIFLKAPGIRSNGTRVADQSIRALAGDYGLTNLGTPRGDESVMQSLRRAETPDFASRFVDIQHAKPGFSRDPSAVVPQVDPRAAIGGSTAQGENAAARIFGTDATGRVNIPKPQAARDPKLTYRPAALPD